MILSIITPAIVLGLGLGVLGLRRIPEKLIQNEEKVFNFIEKVKVPKPVKDCVETKTKHLYEALKSNDYKMYRLLIEDIPCIVLGISGISYALHTPQELLVILLVTISFMWMTRILATLIFLKGLKISAKVLSKLDTITAKKPTKWYTKLLAALSLGYCIYKYYKIFLICGVLFVLTMLMYLLIKGTITIVMATNKKRL